LKFGRHLIALLLAFFILLSVGLATDRKQLSAALDAVNANLKTAAGKQYDEAIGKEFSEKYLASIKQCKQSAPSLNPFDMFLKLDAEGKVQEALVYPRHSWQIALAPRFWPASLPRRHTTIIGLTSTCNSNIDSSIKRQKPVDGH
jgi:hypothetical protein